jgi:Rad3-related DNA helicase
MDERFAQHNVRRLLPRWWQVEATSLSLLRANS